MTKRAFINSLPSLGLLPWARSLAAAGEVEFKLEPEACASQSPGAMWAARVAAMPAGSSEQAQTRFYQAYAASLAGWIESKHPKVKQVRPHIHEAWAHAMNFIVLDVWGGVAHVLSRSPAETEWIIWDGFKQGFDRGYIGHYPDQALSSLLAIIFEANADSHKKLTDSTWRVDKCLTALSEAEKLLPEEGRHYFRSHLVRRIGQCL